MVYQPTILITNDDGINAPGIRALISVMAEIGNAVVALKCVEMQQYYFAAIAG